MILFSVLFSLIKMLPDLCHTEKKNTPVAGLAGIRNTIIITLPYMQSTVNHQNSL